MAKNSTKTPKKTRTPRAPDRDDLEKDLPDEAPDTPEGDDAEWKALCADMGESEDCDPGEDGNDGDDDDGDDDDGDDE